MGGDLQNLVQELPDVGGAPFEFQRLPVLQEGLDHVVQPVDLLLDDGAQARELLALHWDGRGELRPQMVNDQADRIQGVPHLVGDPRGQVGDGREALRLVQARLQLRLLPQALHHLVEAAVQLPDLVATGGGQALVQLALGHAPGRLDDAGNGLGVCPGQDRRARDADAEDQDRGDEPFDEIDPCQLGEVVQDHADQDVAAALVAHHDGDEEVVGLLTEAADVFLAQARRDEQVLALRVHAGPHPAGVRRGDDLLLVADDGDLADAAPLEALDVILQARLAGPALGGQPLHADLDRGGKIHGVPLHLRDELALRPPVQEEQRGQHEHQQPEHHGEQLAPQA